MYRSSSAPEAIHHTTHWSRVLHHNGGLNQYKPCVPCVVRCFQLRSREEIGRRSVGERSPRAPQCSNLKGLPEPQIRHLAQVGVRCSFPSVESVLHRSVAPSSPWRLLAVLEMSVRMPSPPALLRRPPSPGHLVVLHLPPPTLPPAQWGTSSRRPRCILRCGGTAAPPLHR